MLSFSIIFSLALFFLSPISAFARETNTIEMNENGFSPQEINVQVNTEVTFVNKDKVDRWPASNLHPTHLLYPEFDPKKNIPKGESWSFTFNKPGRWRYHDHLFPHMRGEVTVVGETKNKKVGIFDDLFHSLEDTVKRIIQFFTPNNKKPSLSKTQSTNTKEYVNISEDEKEQFNFLDRMIKSDGLEAAWRYVVDKYSNNPYSKAHDLAHFMGTRIFEQEGISGLSICTPAFAFGCYHGFTEAAFTNNLDLLGKMEDACTSVGTVNSGPWASCIHGIGHGVATYFDTTKLAQALATCDTLTSGANYCHDGVFMEFSASAPASFYKDIYNDPLFPCSVVNSKYKQACARNQPRVMTKYLNTDTKQNINNCLLSSDPIISRFCIEAVGLSLAQQFPNNIDAILAICNSISDSQYSFYCTQAAAGELIFQNYKGWQVNSPKLCSSLKDEHQKECEQYRLRLISDYRRSG